MISGNFYTLMKQIAFIFIVVLLSGLQMFGQIKVYGIVKTAEGRGVDFASVIALPSNLSQTILSSTFTDEK